MSVKKIKIVFAGSADFGLLTLQNILNNDRFEVTAVLSQPAKPVGRKQELMLPPIGRFAELNNLKLFTPNNTKELELLLNSLERPDFLVVIAYGLIVPQTVLDWPQIAPINVHGSLLPKYRGASPIQSALLANEEIVGNSYMKMSLEMDAGPIYSVSSLPLVGTETADQVFAALAKQSAEDLPDMLVKIANDDIQPVAQNGAPTFCKKIRKDDARVDWLKDSRLDVISKYRAYYPWPGLFFDHMGQRVIVSELCIEKTKVDFVLKPGEMLIHLDKLFVGTTNEPVEILKFKPAGRSEMRAADWLRGLENKNRLGA